MLAAKNIVKQYDDLTVLNGIDFEIDKAQIKAIVGPSGAGKSTLLHILGTLDDADTGELVINNQSIKGLNKKTLSGFRNKEIGFVFQFHNLLPEFTAAENIAIPAYVAGRKQADIDQNVDELLNLLDIKDRATHKPAQLSGGEQQRVAVARALINSPGIVFADEPSGNLDSKNAEDLHQLFLKLRNELGQAFVIVTHNKELAQMADERHEMRDGKLTHQL
ncbi:ABC transporter ATP-binding protein [Marivirga atlantica]|uniref:ABC transporter ATP-binding protein n=1 Tax=Marivirga atlantica TaxID=1548457 RepID=A0A937DKT9_9BACT|nr:ABC transporter ATP-binding protein [Marivirga atlantica]MBL0766581.1 ABC transporter ATP-binding protein [Marivirga atlantica]